MQVPKNNMYGMDWSIRVSDIIGYVIGCTAIAITIWVVIKQEKLSKKLDRLHHSTREYSLGRICEQLSGMNDLLSAEIEGVKKLNADEDKIDLIKDNLEWNSKGYFPFAIEEIMKEANYLKGTIDPNLYFRINDIIYSSGRLNLESLSYDTRFDSAKLIEEWMCSCVSIVEKSKPIIHEIKKLLFVEKKKSNFKSKDDQ